MAKKGQAVQLQIEVNNDEEWEKLIQRDGLIVVDIYSEWCGPCLGMQANLKKIKLELGGDLLILAVAKADGISRLSRFRNKSEPTWMFISKGKMVNMMFGADAPKLTRLITEELKKEQLAQDGQSTDRTPMEVTDLSDEERVRYDAAESIQREIREKEERKIAKELLERRTKECDTILTNVPNFGIVLIFPSAKDKYKEVLHDILDEAGLVLQQTEKVRLNEGMLDELLFFSENKFPKRTIEDFVNNKISFALLLRRTNENLSGQIDDIVLQMVYGNCRKPPGDEKSPAFKLRKVEVEDNPDQVLLGIWAPSNALCKAAVLKLLFPNICDPKKIPVIKEIPLHVAVAYDAFKTRDVFDLSEKYPGVVMSFGFFSSDIPGDAKLLGKTTDKFESRTSPVTYEEKIVIQLAKINPDAFGEFEELGPSYMSRDVDIGELDCKYFFPPGYNVPEAEIITYLKKKSRKKGRGNRTKAQPDQVDDQALSVRTETDTSGTIDINAEETGEEVGATDDVNNESEEEEDADGSKDDEDEEDGNKENEEGIDGVDKATSPVAENED
ncbi:uncharacterized protein LOC115879656 isoform X2 [Sitophilus oryzae]|uniref:Uncharacterized protein LOC115879656 isoform X2 n=1 Tax=Sitophilus oryzae TaxID=7048 RepID=A0A6J2XP48_SITOR|nr:uncharacterized protein LOC115879656 isoform X2 [Sitophilus oryzae]